MKKATIAEVKAIEINILSEIHRICVTENLRYSLSCGTLLGAVRHRGFIPWDDDIDIYMPRPDYERFIEYCMSNETLFRLISSETEPRYGYLFSKAADKTTLLKDGHSSLDDLDIGVFVDIFPVDGLGNTYTEAIKRFKATRFKRELLVASNWKRFARSKTHSLKYEPIRFALFIFSRFISKRKLILSIEKELNKVPFEDSSFSACVCSAYREKEIIKTDIYKEYGEIGFEGSTFSAIKAYREYLTAIYGDYMKLPPKEKQTSHHRFTVYKK